MCLWPGFLNCVWSHVTCQYQRLFSSLDAMRTVHASECLQIHLMPLIFLVKFSSLPPETQDKPWLLHLQGYFFLTSPFFFEEVSIYQHFPDSLYPCVRQAEGSCVIASCCDRIPNRNQLGWGRFIWALDSERSGLCSWAKFIMVAERGMFVPVWLPPSSSYSIWTLSLCKVPSAFRVNLPPTRHTQR